MFIVSDIFLPFLKYHRAPHESRFSDTSLAVIGAVLLFFVAMAYALGIGSDVDLSTQDPKTLQDFKDMYRKKRDDFRSNPQAMEELLEWKRKNDRFDFKILYAFCLFFQYAMHSPLGLIALVCSQPRHWLTTHLHTTDVLDWSLRKGSEKSLGTGLLEAPIQTSP